MMVSEEGIKWLVSVRCFTYNQSRYIIDAMNGFVMQQTNFPFVCAIVDDASTDGEQEVIRNYVCENFDLQDVSIAYDKDTDYGHVTYAQHKTNKNCYFAIVYLRENHYRQKKSKAPYIKEWLRTKYKAICEGDDYWTDPLKLQKQVDMLEANEHVDMCCTNASILTSNGESQWPHYDESRLAAVEDVILFGLGGRGVCFQTATCVYKRSLLTEKNYPKYCKECHVGDYPLMLWAAMNGGLYYINEMTAVYRLHSVGSWTMRQKEIPVEKKIPGWRSEFNMLKGLDEWSHGAYSAAFRERIGSCLFRFIKGNTNDANLIINEFHDELNMLNWRQKLFVFVVRRFPRTLFLVKQVKSLVKRRNK